MDGKIKMSNEELELISVEKIFDKVCYEIPIYQRNYSWEATHIEQLMDDIYGFEGVYFLGNLIVNKKENKNIGNGAERSFKYEVIDGQQRLTTLYLLFIYLDKELSENSLKFEARDNSNKNLEKIKNSKDCDTKDGLTDGYKIIRSYFKDKGDDFTEEFKEKLSNVQIVRIQVPKDIDLNHYFEIMNTRGEQLKLHEIAKAKFLSCLEKDDKLIADDIWEYCSNIDSYIQMNYPKDLREKIFGKDWVDFNLNNFDDLKVFYENKKTENNTRKSIKSILENPSVYKKNNENEKNKKNKGFESIISFPNFLLQVNKIITRQEKEEESSLDDKILLKNLKNNWESEEKSKEILFYLLKLRFLFDKYILKRKFDEGYKEQGKWSLEKLKKYRNEKDNKDTETPNYIGTFGKENEDTKLNKQIRTLQSAFRITYTSPKTMHWISKVLEIVLNVDDIKGEKIVEVLEKYGIEKVEESNYTESRGFGFNRIVFSYLDYILYRDGFGDILKAFQENWDFKFRNSIEHFYPQNPKNAEVWAEDDLNNFGNLALITSSGNSILSNRNPFAKTELDSEVIKQSLKLQIMAKIMEKGKWDVELSKSHCKDMFNILEKEINKYKNI